MRQVNLSVKKKMIIFIFFILFFINYNIYPQNKTIEWIEKKDPNITINWTKGIIYSEYTIYNENNLTLKELENLAFENAYHNLVLALLDLYLESGITLKESLKNNLEIQNKFHNIKNKVQIQKKIVYLNKITYLIAFPFLNYFNKNREYYFEDLENAYQLPVKKEKEFYGIIIYVPISSYKPSLRIKLISNTGKLILYLPAKENQFFSNDAFIYKEPEINQPYIIYTEKILNQNDIVIDQGDIQFLIATKKIFQPNSIKVILYDAKQ